MTLCQKTNIFMFTKIFLKILLPFLNNIYKIINLFFIIKFWQCLDFLLKNQYETGSLENLTENENMFLEM